MNEEATENTALIEKKDSASSTNIRDRSNTDDKSCEQKPNDEEAPPFDANSHTFEPLDFQTQEDWERWTYIKSKSWEAVADRKLFIEKSFRWVKLLCTVTGVILNTIASILDDENSWRQWLSITGSFLIFLLPWAESHLSIEKVTERVDARLISQQIKSEMWKSIAGIGDYKNRKSVTAQRTLVENIQKITKEYVNDPSEKVNIHPLSNLHSFHDDMKDRSGCDYCSFMQYLKYYACFNCCSSSKAVMKKKEWGERFDKYYSIKIQDEEETNANSEQKLRNFYIKKRVKRAIQLKTRKAEELRGPIFWYCSSEKLFALMSGALGLLLNTGNFTLTTDGLETDGVVRSAFSKLLSKSGLFSTTFMTMSSTFGAGLAARGYREECNDLWAAAIALDDLYIEFFKRQMKADEEEHAGNTSTENLQENDNANEELSMWEQFVIDFENIHQTQRLKTLTRQVEKAKKKKLSSKHSNVSNK